MLEFLIGAGALLAVGTIAMIVLKFLVMLVLLPFKLAALVAKSVLGIVIAIPLTLIAINVASFALPVVLLLLLLPVIAGVAVLVWLFKLVF